MDYAAATMPELRAELRRVAAIHDAAAKERREIAAEINKRDGRAGRLKDIADSLSARDREILKGLL